MKRFKSFIARLWSQPLIQLYTLTLDFNLTLSETDLNHIAYTFCSNWSVHNDDFVYVCVNVHDAKNLSKISDREKINKSHLNNLITWSLRLINSFFIWSLELISSMWHKASRCIKQLESISCYYYESELACRVGNLIWPLDVFRYTLPVLAILKNCSAITMQRAVASLVPSMML